MAKNYTREWAHQWIDTETALESLSSTLIDEPIISVDTETVGWDTGNERLCLIQIGIPSKKMVAVVDTLAVANLKSLEPVLSGKAPQLVAHNAAFEEKQFGRYGIKLRGIVDTLTMARKLRPDLPNHTLQTCCRLLLDIDISKTEQTSDWSRRPLTESQLLYACLDAEIAYILYVHLAEMEAKLQIDAAASVPVLMEQLFSTVEDRFALTKTIAADLALLNAREEMIRQTIRAKLIDGEPAYKGDFGKCFVTKIKNTEANPARVRSEFPEIADLVISEQVKKDRLKTVMKEHGIDERRFESVLDTIGFTDRMTLTLKNPKDRVEE